MRFPQARIIIMAKAPRVGQAKTRLIPALGARGAVRLHCHLLIHTLEMLKAAALCPIRLYGEPGISHPFFQRCRREYDVELIPQQGEDLGKRMQHAVKQTLKSAEFTIVLGADCAGVTREDLEQACAALAAGQSMVLGPADDGGYVLLGMRRGCRGPFAGVSWGSGRVLTQTRQQLRNHYGDWLELPVRWDVDRPADLKRWRALQPLPLWHRA